MQSVEFDVEESVDRMYFHIEEHLVEVEPALARIAKVEVAHQSLAGTAGIVLVVGFRKPKAFRLMTLMRLLVASSFAFE